MRSRALVRSSLSLASVAALLLSAGCATDESRNALQNSPTTTVTTTETTSESTEDADAGTASSSTDKCSGENYEQAVRWLQQSSEAAALQIQTFRLATERIHQLHAEYMATPEGLPPAIVTDLDETIISNAAFLAQEIAECRDYTDWENWGEWELQGQPTLLPGAREFLQAVDALGIRIFYISDRYEENKAATVATLQSLGLPQVPDDAENVLLLGEPKQQRREQVMQQNHILMLLGDTMHDFDAAFAKDVLPEDAEAQKGMVYEAAPHLGYDWIVLPNPGYGTWSDLQLNTW